MMMATLFMILACVAGGAALLWGGLMLLAFAMGAFDEGGHL